MLCFLTSPPSHAFHIDEQVYSIELFINWIIGRYDVRKHVHKKRGSYRSTYACCSFFIPPWDRPAEIEVYKDPTTGATIRRLKRIAHMQTPDSDSNGDPLPATCMTRFCAYAGQPHKKCEPIKFSAPPHVPWYSAYHAPCTLPFVNPYASTDESLFRAWLHSQPGNQMPREMPPGWVPPTPLFPNGWTDARWQPGHRHTRSDPVIPGLTTPRHRRTRSDPVIPGLTTPMPHASPRVAGYSPDEVADGLPRTMAWNDGAGGRVTWTPNPWVAHPLPHPDMSAQNFWHAVSNPWQPWRGPGGWTPATGPLSLARMYAITGGHPLPGQDPFWTPANWTPPLHALSGGMVVVSQWLAPNGRNAEVPHVLWDAAVDHPEKIRRMTSRGGIVKFAGTDYWKMPATFPESANVQVHLPHMRKSWGPVVLSKKTPIEVRDIFEAVWNYVQTPITWDDVAAVLKGPGGAERWRRIHYACYRRCLTAPALSEYERREGVKRVDFLEGRTVFWGVWPCYNPDGTWYLCMGFLPKIPS